MAKKRTKVFRWLGQGLLVYGALVGGLYLAQRQILYLPSLHPPVPQQYGVSAQAAQNALQTTVTEDGLSLRGWFYPPVNKDAPVIVWFHGNGGTYADRLHAAPPHLAHGRGVLLAEYRGYAGNPGKPSEQGLYRDARAWIGFLQQAGYPLEKIILYGESLGTGVAVQMAREFPQARALVLQAPYTSLPDVAARTYFFVPVHWMMKDQFRSIDKIEGITMPLLIVQGTKDEVIPISHGQALYARAPEPKKLVAYENYFHNNLPHAQIADALSEWLKAHP